MSNISFDAMEFGSENDLEIALTELKWMKKTKGKLAQSDFAMVSEKYKFPIDFLKKGLTGLTFPDDYRISRSEWFPILYSWIITRRELSLNLFKFQIDYLRTAFRLHSVLVVLALVLLQSGITLQGLLDLDWSQSLWLIAVPFVFFFVSVCLELGNSIAAKKMQLDEYQAYLKEKGFDRVIARNERFIRRNYKQIIYAGHIILEKMRSSPSMTFFYVGAKEEEEPQQLSKRDRLLIRLHLIPRPTATIEKQKVPIFYGENADLEYKKRIDELERENRIK